MTKYDDALDRVRKLLKLEKQAGTPEEAATAAAMAQKLMYRFNIDRLTAEANPEPEDEKLYHTAAEKSDGTQGTPLDLFGKKQVTWKGRLAYRIGRCNQVSVYNGSRWTEDGRSYRRTIEMIGRKNDMIATAYLYQYVVREIERLAAMHAGKGRVWLNNFCLGAVNAVGNRLYEAQEQAKAEAKAEAEKQAEAERHEADGEDVDFAVAGAMREHAAKALVRVEKALVTVQQRYERAEEYAKTKVKVKASRPSEAKTSVSGREAGRKAGESIRLTKAKADIGPGKR